MMDMDGIRLGRFFGVDLHIHASIVLGLALIALLGPLGLLWTVLVLFGCVVLHEYGHALMARVYRIKTRRITLYPLAGVAELERETRAPGAELLIAGAGPGVNLAAAAFLALTGLFWSLVGLGEAIGVVVQMNLVLGLFNLLPIFPMDGGRIARALLQIRWSKPVATLATVRGGQALAAILSLASFGVFGLGTGLIYLVMAGFFIWASEQELARVQAIESTPMGRFVRASGWLSRRLGMVSPWPWSGPRFRRRLAPLFVELRARPIAPGRAWWRRGVNHRDG